jgi:nucleolar protein 56
VRIVNDNYLYAKVVQYIKRRSNLTEESLPELTAIVGDEAKAQEILDASRSSMGTDISDIDMVRWVFL